MQGCMLSLGIEKEIQIQCIYAIIPCMAMTRVTEENQLEIPYNSNFNLYEMQKYVNILYIIIKNFMFEVQ